MDKLFRNSRLILLVCLCKNKNNKHFVFIINFFFCESQRLNSSDESSDCFKTRNNFSNYQQPTAIFLKKILEIYFLDKKKTIFLKFIKDFFFSNITYRTTKRDKIKLNTMLKTSNII